MGKITGFLEIERQDRGYEKPEQRVHNYREFVHPLPAPKSAKQAARCMDCGIPFCHQGCPVNNLIPDWNNLVYRDQWRTASETLHSTNNFPEFTGRICPAPCEASCTLNIMDNPVTIKTIECQIVDRAWEEGWIQPVIGAEEDRQDGGGGGLGPRRHGLRPATGARRPQRHPVRKDRPHRRAAALRHSRLQDGKAPDRPPHAPDGSRRRGVPHQCRSRRRRLDGHAAGRL